MLAHLFQIKFVLFLPTHSFPPFHPRLISGPKLLISSLFSTDKVGEKEEGEEIQSGN